MRILRVAQKTYPETKGGGAYHVHAMSRDQAEMGHDVTILTVGTGPRSEERSGYSVVRYPSVFSLLGNDISPGVWRHLRDAGEYDVIHAHSHLYFSTNLAAIRRRLSEVPLAITNHGLYSQNAPERLFDAYLRTVGKWTFNSADTVFCYTDEEHEQLRRFGVSSTIEVVHNGIDMQQFTPDGPAHEGVTGNPAVLFVGRLVEGKRPDKALQAFSQLRGSFPDAGLTVCGNGPLRTELETHARELGVTNAVRFLGHIPYEKMPSVYRAADVMVLLSRAEGMPRTVLEAMAAGVPVVVSDLEQVAPVVATGGETVPQGDVSGFARALKAVLSNDGYDPQAVIQGKFDWAETVEQTTKVLRQLSSGTR